ncbi:MAG: hypothetical protein HY962_05465 [Ignavibacteriae bacterium]|nr:hypothetical protein [Ignavibacteriota bacterium]
MKHILAALLACVLLSSLHAQPSGNFRLLPKDNEVKGWTRKGEPRSFKAEKLWEYINGGADVYIDYGFKEVVTVDLAAGDKSMVIDVYEFADFEGAFGLYARERAPSYKFISIGAGGYQEGVSLNFYQAKNYIKISAFSDDQDTRTAMKKAADIVSRNIGTFKKAPTLLAYFLPGGLVKNSETFEKKNYLGRNELRDTYTAQYTVKGKSLTAFFSQADTPASAETRLKGLRPALSQPGSKDKAYAGLGTSVLTGKHREAKDVVLLVKGRILLGVYPATDASLVKGFLKDFVARFP